MGQDSPFGRGEFLFPATTPEPAQPGSAYNAETLKMKPIQSRLIWSLV